MTKRAEESLYHGIITVLIAAFVAFQGWIALELNGLAVRVALVEQTLKQVQIGGIGHESNVAILASR
jgi:hypothetical protein